MKALHFNSNLEKLNPIQDVELSFSVSENAVSGLSGFLSGQGKFMIQRPEINVTGVTFSGLNSAVDFADTSVQDQVNISLGISGGGGFNNNDKSGIFNIEKIHVFTGISQSDLETKFNILNPDIVKNISLSEINQNIDFSITSDELNNNTDEIFYKFLPFDRINSGNNFSDIISGSMLTSNFLNDIEGVSGFTGITFTGEELYIDRSGIDGSIITLLDIKLDSTTINLSGNCETVSFNKNIVDDFSINLFLRTEKEIILTGFSGLASDQKPTFVDVAIEESHNGSGNAKISGRFSEHVVSRDPDTNLFFVRKVS